MTNSKNKIMALHLPPFTQEQAKIYYRNGASTKIANKYNINTSLANAIINQNTSKVLKEIRKQEKAKTSNMKAVKISYSCDVYSNVTNSWHKVNETLASGQYQDLKQIIELVHNKKEKNNNSNIRNLTFKYNFIMK